MHWTELSAEEQTKIVMRFYDKIVKGNTYVYTNFGVSEHTWISPDTGTTRSLCRESRNALFRSYLSELLQGWFKENPRVYVENMPDYLCKEIFRSAYADSLVAQQEARENVIYMARDLRTRLQKKEKGFWSIFVEHPDHTFVGKLALWCLLRPFA